MLQAESNEGELITLATLTRAEIEMRKQMNTFYCPICREEVIVKAGSKVLPHFAHRSKTTCPSSSGAEGAYHQKGKLALFQWLKSQHLRVKLEGYIPEINQRPDIILFINGRKVAIEFQCSKLSAEQLQQRNNGYKKAGIIPLWILGANHFKRLGTQKLKLNPFSVQCIHQFTSSLPPLIFFLCPHSHQFITFSPVSFSSLTNAYGSYSFMKLNHISFKEIFTVNQLTDKELYKFWLKEKRRFRLRPRRQRYGNERIFNEWLYQKKMHVEYLPSVVHLPVHMQWKMKTPLWDWQSRLCIDLLHPIPIDTPFTFRTCFNHLSKYMYPKDYFPLIHSSEHPIQAYLKRLEQLNIIIQMSPNHYKKKKPLSFHNHIESALKGDKLVINELLAYNSKQT